MRGEERRGGEWEGSGERGWWEGSEGRGVVDSVDTEGSRETNVVKGRRAE